MDAPVDLEALTREARAVAIRALAGNADLVDAVLPRRRLDHADLRGQRAPIVFEWNEQIGLERDEEVPGALLVARPATEHAERVHRERQRVALVPAERQDRAASRGLRVRGRTAALVDRHALRQRDAETVPALEIRAHERGGAQIDHQRVAFHREAEGDRIGAEGRPGTAQRGDQGRRGHRVDPDQACPCRHLDVIGAAAAHPDVVDADERDAMRLRPLDHGARRVVHPQHAALVATVEEHRHARLSERAHRAAPSLEAGVVGDVEQLRQAGVLVAAQGRVDHVVGEDPGLLGLVPDPAHGPLGQRAGLGDAQVDTVGGIGVRGRRGGLGILTGGHRCWGWYPRCGTTTCGVTVMSASEANVGLSRLSIWELAVRLMMEAKIGTREASMRKTMQRITPFLWFDDQAEEAVDFYVSIFKNSKIRSIARYDEEGAKAAGRPKGSVMTVAFELDGQDFTALNGGSIFKFTEAMSLVVNCETQEEVDYFWERLSAGGQEVQCGWLKDRFGVSWQVVPTALVEMLQDKDPHKAKRVMAAMLKMKKISIEGLRQAYEGR